MTIDDVLRGPNQVDGPAPGVWEVTGRPDAGITPKFTIRDARGDTYIIKLDPAANPELPSSVELISTKLFHAIGYHVPEPKGQGAASSTVTLLADRVEVRRDSMLVSCHGEQEALELPASARDEEICTALGQPYLRTISIEHRQGSPDQRAWRSPDDSLASQSPRPPDTAPPVPPAHAGDNP